MISHADVQRNRIRAYIAKMDDAQKLDFLFGAKLNTDANDYSDEEKEEFETLFDEYYAPRLKLSDDEEILFDPAVESRYKLAITQQFRTQTRLGKKYSDTLRTIPDGKSDPDIKAGYLAKASEEGVLAEKAGAYVETIENLGKLKDNYNPDEWRKLCDKWTKEAQADYEKSLSDEEKRHFAFGRDLLRESSSILKKTVGELEKEDNETVNDELLSSRSTSALENIRKGTDVRFREDDLGIGHGTYIFEETDKAHSERIIRQYNSLKSDTERLDFIVDLHVMDGSERLTDEEKKSLKNITESFLEPKNAEGNTDEELKSVRASLISARRVQIRSGIADDYDSIVAEQTKDPKNLLDDKFFDRCKARTRMLGRNYYLDEVYRKIAGEGAANVVLADESAEKTVNEIANAPENEEDMEDLKKAQSKMKSQMADAAEVGKIFRDPAAVVTKENLKNISDCYKDMQATEAWYHHDSKRYDSLMNSLDKVHQAKEVVSSMDHELGADERGQFVFLIDDINRQNEIYLPSKKELKKKSGIDSKREETSNKLSVLINPDENTVKQNSNFNLNADMERLKPKAVGALQNESDALTNNTANASARKWADLKIQSHVSYGETRVVDYKETREYRQARELLRAFKARSRSYDQVKYDKMKELVHNRAKELIRKAQQKDYNFKHGISAEQLKSGAKTAKRGRNNVSQKSSGMNVAQNVL